MDGLFMELASESRRDMLQILKERDEKLSKIAKEIDMTIQEAHRNSVRLAKCGLIEKKPDGMFSLTTLGQILTKQIASFSFPVRHKDYFETHTTGELEPRHIRRIGDLEKSNQIKGMGPVLENWKRIGVEAEEFIHIITTQYPMDVAESYANRAKHGITFWYVMGHNTTVPKERDHLIKKIAWRKLLAEDHIQRKMKSDVQLCVTVTEKEACIFFPDKNGVTDMMSGLFSDDVEFRQWCIDYFDDIWNDAEEFDESKLNKI